MLCPQGGQLHGRSVLLADQQYKQLFPYSLLVVRSDLVGDAHVNAPAGPFGIFRIGRVDPDRGYVHVFDDENLDILLSELDTVADFVAYLTRKEAFICSGRVVLAPGEEDLLAYYLTHTGEDGEHDFVVPPSADVINFDHLYRDIRDDDQYIAKKSADKISYLIDDLIEHVSGSAASRTLIDGNELSAGDYERALRVLAAESRLARRHLAHAFLDLLSSASARRRARTRCVVRGEGSSVGYCFLVCPFPQGKDYDKHRRSRRMLLACYCKAMKIGRPALQHVIGFATEPLDGDRRSEDLVYLDVSQWTEEDAKEASEIQRETGILASPKITHVHEKEYPVQR